MYIVLTTRQVDNKYLSDISRLKTSMEGQMELLKVYGQQNKDGWKGKSAELVHGKIGFRTGNPKLVKDRKFTWDAVTEDNCYVEVVQEESFYVEANAEDLSVACSIHR